MFLRAAPIDVSAIVQELLLDRMRSTVLTSATLAVAGSFDYVRDRLGIQRRRGAARAVRVRFHDAEPALSAAADATAEVAGVRRRGVAREVTEILRRTHGRAFVLFTSYATHARRVRNGDGDGSVPRCSSRAPPRAARCSGSFRSTPHAVLFATSSFWQGVDVVGEQLSCVIIDKLPFASPGDPITAARIEHINAMGGDAFNEYQVPLAILTLLQGLGRLIRHRTDRGILAVLDPRLRTMGYGRRFLESFPPAPIAQELGAIERFFRMT